MKFIVLGSGSTGNAVLICSENTRVLIDAGLSAREIGRRLSSVGLAPADLDGIIITHEHSDHVGGLRTLLSAAKCSVYITGETEEAYYTTLRSNGNGNNEAERRRDAMKQRTVRVDANSNFCIGDIDFEPFTVPHDAVDNFGFVAKHAGVCMAALTDFGHMTQLVRERLSGCDLIFIESNHSRDMLRACPVYSWSLKQRIASKRGHFSNEDLADWMTNDFDGTARHIVLAHLSQRANDPALARITAESALQMRAPLFPAETTITISNHREPSDWICF
ncbi:MAG: MBL fold metallo-hydrolase [Pyrinomonadaceae bacterium]